MRAHLEDAFADQLLRAAPAAICVTRIDDGRFLVVNDAWCDTFGWSREEAMARAAPELGIWPDLAERALFLTTLHAKGRLREHHLRLRRRDGRTLDVLVNVEPVTHAGAACLLTSAVDVTARMEEAALRESLLAAQSDLDQAFIVADGTRYTYVNDAYCRMVGRTREEILAMPDAASVLLAPESLEASLAVRERRWSGERRDARGETTLLRPDGTRVEVEYLAKALSDDPSGRRVVALLRDITARKAAERAAAREVVHRKVARTLLTFLSRDRGLDARNRREVGRELGREVGPRAVEDIVETFRGLGLGTLRVARDEPGRLTFEGEGLIEVVPGSGSTTCTIVLGFLEGALGATGAKVLGAEMRCCSMGHDACTFVLRSREA